MSKPKRDEIEAEIGALDACKQFVPPQSATGDDNHGAINAAVSALADRLTVDLAYEIAGSSQPSYVEQYRIEAALWLAGEREESLSSEWASFKSPPAAQVPNLPN
jgi:hypothetical protein